MTDDMTVDGMMADRPHPGELVRHECLEPLGLSVTAGAKVLGVARKTLDNLVNGRSGISPEMAIRLAEAFGGSANAWQNMQSAYDLAQVSRNAAAIRASVDRTLLPTTHARNG